MLIIAFQLYYKLIHVILYIYVCIIELEFLPSVHGIPHSNQCGTKEYRKNCNGIMCIT